METNKLTRHQRQMQQMRHKLNKLKMAMSRLEVAIIDEDVEVIANELTNMVIEIESIYDRDTIRSEWHK